MKFSEFNARPCAIAMAIAALYTPNTFANDDNKDQTDIEKIVVTAEHMLEPGKVITDPKQPRQPLPAADGADYLKTVAGFNLIRKGGVSGDPVFRGMAASRLTIINDGNMVLGGCSSRMDPPTAYVTPQNYDQITIIKGPQSVESLPANATVKFERDHTKKQHQGISGDVNLVLASFGRQDLTADVSYANEFGHGRITATKASAVNYQDGNGDDVNSHYDRQALSAELAYNPSDNSAIVVSLANSEGEAAYADRGMDGSVFDREQYGIKYIHSDITPWLNQVELSFNTVYVDHVMDNYSLRTFTPSMMMPNPSAMNPDRDSTSSRIQINTKPTANWKVNVGLDTHDNVHTNRMTMNQTMMPFESKDRVEDGRFKQKGVFVESEYNITSHWSWMAGLRNDHWQATDNRMMLMKSMMMTVANPTFGETREDDLLSGFSRLEFSQNNQKWYLGWGQASRFPDYWELIGKARSSESSPSSFYVDPEETQQIDLGWIGKMNDIQWDVSMYYADINDYLLLEQYGNMGLEMVRNIEATTWGGEASLSWWPIPNLKLQSTLAFNRGTNDTDNKTLAQQAPTELRIDASYTFDTWQVGTLLRLVDEQNRVSVGQGTIVGLDTTPTKGFGILSLNASKQWQNDLMLSVGIDNVLDKTYQEHLSRTATNIPGFVNEEKVNEPGRTVWLKMNYQF